MRLPLREFCERERISQRHAYNEHYAGNLVFTKIGRRIFIDDADAERWRALAPKIGGRVGDVALQAAERAIETLGQAVQRGDIDQARAVKRLRAAAIACGLRPVTV
jgi:hypothetical protein